MRLPRVSQNVQYELHDDYAGRGDFEVTISCNVGGELLCNRVVVPAYARQRGPYNMAERAIEQGLHDLSRSAGDFIVFGRKP